MVRVALVLALLSSTAFAANLESFERILLPIMTEPIPGLLGSVWVSEFRAENRAPVHVRFTEEGFDCGIAQCALLGLEPGEIYTARPWRVSRRGEPPGVFVYAERQYSDQLSFSLTVRETSRGGSTAIPVIREGDFRKNRIDLPDVPLRSGLRQTLRIYDADARGYGAVVVHFFGPGIQVPPVASLLVHLFTPKDNIAPHLEWPYHPGYAELSSLAEKVRPLQMLDSVRIQIEPLTPGLNYWAFVSVTDNATQQVTLITPQ